MRGDCRSFQTSACSRPPPPRTRTFIKSEQIRLGVEDEGCQTRQSAAGRSSAMMNAASAWNSGKTGLGYGHFPWRELYRKEMHFQMLECPAGFAQFASVTSNRPGPAKSDPPSALPATPARDRDA